MDQLDNDLTGLATGTETRQPEAPELPKGTVIDRYIISDLIGKGGMGVVYRAFDPDLNRPVALKLLHVSKASAENSQDVAQRKTRIPSPGSPGAPSRPPSAGPTTRSRE